MERPLLVLNHIPKTAGSALRQVVVANVGRENLVNLDPAVFSLVAPHTGDGGRAPWHWQAKLDCYRPVFESMMAADGAANRCYAGHSAPLFIAAAGARRVRAFCLLREPVERLLSGYFYLKRREQSRRLELPGGAPHLLETARKKRWGIVEIYRELARARQPSSDIERHFAPLFNGQTRQILACTGDPERLPLTDAAGDLDAFGQEALRILDDTHVVGTQERFSQSVQLFADSFGWASAFVPFANVTPRSSATVDETTRDLINANNRLDAELHAHFSRRLAELPAVGRISDFRGRTRQRASQRWRKLRRRLPV